MSPNAKSPVPPPLSPLPADVPLPPSPKACSLGVKDALSYLETVKVEFQDNPDVYNHFIDIMKDFMSQVIDIPSVIERVLALFNGHITLIQAFNTFLPPGHRIDCAVERDYNLITITTPSGTTTQSHRRSASRPDGEEIKATEGE